MATSVYCIASNSTVSAAIIDALRRAGLRGSDVSAVYPHRETASPDGAPQQTKAPVGALAGAAAGGVFGASVGWLMGMGSLVIPGFGPLIAAGPILAILSGAAIGATTGGLAGSLIGHGIPEVIAKRYEMHVRDGHVMISVHAIDGAEVDKVTLVLEQHGAENIHAVPDAKPAVISDFARIDQERAAEPQSALHGH
jgi:outer membrane lipoprotein SlyB